MEEKVISILTDDNVMSKAEEFLSDIGTDINTAVTVFIKHLARKDSKPFDLKRANIIKKKPMLEAYGLLKGKVWMSDDFDEPLEEMNEYM